ncbi:S-adenosyl-L-methionine-dependent methyltransferases superfamily protein [Actinidia rufa]|uniref:Methyltransferase n=1 Tax=Actinidia rufa TaxID=165716 RepID=A0A7J0E6F2_9ERIC|nr:S-adenosyl-L-methionine-dependent methyltransferases superfamily protein [Actinidia rufa]
MAISVQNLIKERKYPFIFSLFLLPVFVGFLLLIYTESPITFTADFAQSQSKLKSTCWPPPSIPNPPISNPGTDTPPKHDQLPSKGTVDGHKGIEIEEAHEAQREAFPEPSPPCLVPLLRGYKGSVLWPKSRDMIWFDNVPHSKLVEYKKDQNWVCKSDDYLVFPGGGFVERDLVVNALVFLDWDAPPLCMILPIIEWGKHTRVILDVRCGVASFGGYLLDKDVITMSFARKDEHEAQIQFALEQGMPATVSLEHKGCLFLIMSDLIHCARCRVHWDADGGKPLMELNPILSFMLSQMGEHEHKDLSYNSALFLAAMVALTESMCWNIVAKTVDSSGIYQKPVSSSCYEQRKENNPPVAVCDPNDKSKVNDILLAYNIFCPPASCWHGEPVQLARPLAQRDAEEIFYDDTKHWSALVSDVYLEGLLINWSSLRNVMDMNTGFGGFAAVLIDLPLWVMNVIPVNEPDSLSAIFDRGLIGVYHDWCESFNTYPPTYDLLHSSFLFKKLTQRCEIVGVAVEMDCILRPGGYVLVQDTVEMINNLSPLFRSLHWSITLYQEQFLVKVFGVWKEKSRYEEKAPYFPV